MDQNRIKMNILWLKQFQWQFCKYKKTYFELSRDGLRFQNRKAHFTYMLWTAGSNSENREGSLTKMRMKGYVLFLAVDLEMNGFGRSREAGRWPAAISTVERHCRRGRSSPEFVTYAISGNI